MILTFPTHPAGPPRPVPWPGAAGKSLDAVAAFVHPSSMEATDLLSTAEVCRRYGVTRQTVRLWVDDGLPLAPETLTDPKTGRTVRLWFRAADVAAYVEARKAAGRWGKSNRGPDKTPRTRRSRAAKDAADAA